MKLEYCFIVKKSLTNQWTRSIVDYFGVWGLKFNAHAPKLVKRLAPIISTRLSDVTEFLSPRTRLLLLTVTIALVLTLIMELLNMEMFFGLFYTRALLATAIAIAISIALERMAKRIRHN